MQWHNALLNKDTRLLLRIFNFILVSHLVIVGLKGYCRTILSVHVSVFRIRIG
jgi:hypothetical protein